MKINLLTIIATIINFALLGAIIIVLFNTIKGINNFINKNNL
jgi:hypothetical protein